MVNIISQEFFTFWFYERGEEVLNLKNWWNLIEDGEVRSGWARCVKVGRKYGIKFVHWKNHRFWEIFQTKINFDRFSFGKI